MLALATIGALRFVGAGSARPSGSAERSPTFPLAAILLFVALWVSCGGGSGTSGGGGNPGTPAGTYNLTVSGTYTSGSTTLKHDITLTLTLKLEGVYAAALRNVRTPIRR
jgi:hypothetical protein